MQAKDWGIPALQRGGWTLMRCAVCSVLSEKAHADQRPVPRPQTSFVAATGAPSVGDQQGVQAAIRSVKLLRGSTLTSHTSRESVVASC